MVVEVGMCVHGVPPLPNGYRKVLIVLLVVECKKTDRISSGTEDFPHIKLTLNI